MAATVTVLCATQDMLRLLTTSTVSEGADSVPIPLSTLAGYCDPGPLKSMLSAPFFEGPPGPGAVTTPTLNEDARLSVTQAGYGAVPSTDSNSYLFSVISTVPTLTVRVGGGVGGQAITELQFNVTNGR